jgi:hypothetical protein
MRNFALPNDVFREVMSSAQCAMAMALDRSTGEMPTGGSGEPIQIGVDLS